VIIRYLIIINTRDCRLSWSRSS